MKLAKILSVLKDEPLYCAPGYRHTLLELFQQHADLKAIDFRATRTGKAQSGSELEVEQAEKRGNVMIIPVGGPIAQGLGEFEKGAGAVDMDDIRAELDDAESDDEVENIILNFDTPGGMVTGTPELGEYIASLEKPVYAFTRGQMCSAGYWLAASCSGIFATSSAQIGCIGVCAAFYDLTKMADKAGVKVKVFGSGDYKGMGTPGTALTPKQELWIQESIISQAQMFYAHVRANRGNIADADMQGQTFRGREAVQRGFVDDIMADLDELISFLS